MKKRKQSQRVHSPNRFHLTFTLIALVAGLSFHSRAEIPIGHVKTAENGLEEFAKELGKSLRELAGTPVKASAHATVTSRSNSSNDFSACPQFFVNGKAPVVAHHPTDRALCYDAFAILHSGTSKTPVLVAEKLNRASVADAHEKRTNKFFPDARLRSAERATLEDYKGSGFDRGHMAPAGDMPTVQAMAQSFSLANMVPQAPEHNRGVWAKSVESATRKYAARATGDTLRVAGANQFC